MRMLVELTQSDVTPKGDIFQIYRTANIAVYGSSLQCLNPGPRLPLLAAPSTGEQHTWRKLR